MIEFDVLRLKDGRLVLAHDYEDAAERTPLSLDEGLDHFAEEAYAGVELDVDLKLPGYEREVVEGLVERGLDRRAIDVVALPREPRAGRRAVPGTPPRLVGAARAARLHEERAGAAGLRHCARDARAAARPSSDSSCGRAQCEAMMATGCSCRRGWCSAVQEAGGEVFVWTVDDRKKIAASSDSVWTA